VIHHRQGLAFGFEAGDYLAAVHAGLDDLERDAAADGVLLLGDEDQPHAAFPDLFEEFVGADDRAGALGGDLVAGRIPVIRSPQKISSGLMRCQEFFNASTQIRVGPARLIEKGQPVFR
jgi:hypothetical protein